MSPKLICPGPSAGPSRRRERLKTLLHPGQRRQCVPRRRRRQGTTRWRRRLESGLQVVCDNEPGSTDPLASKATIRDELPDTARW